VQIKLVPVNAPYFNGAPAEREVHPVAGGHRDGGRPVGGRMTKSLEESQE